MYVPAALIKKKRAGEALTRDEISFFISGYTNGTLPDYQMAALLMAIYFRGMSESETLDLTSQMLHSGIVLDLSDIPRFKVDKHSTGGVGDKTSLILGPIVAAAGLAVPMISGRGLGHTGGTLDKLESIPGFNTQLDLTQFRQAVRDHSICFIGQTKEICPADKKIYALRDVTGTVESLPLICASIMSKKLAEGIDGLVLDVKYGSGAFMKGYDEATALARGLMQIAKGAGKKVAALMTNMDQPLGAFAGNSVEVEECVRILRNEPHADAKGRDLSLATRELSIDLSAWMIYLGGGEKSVEKARARAEELLRSGRAYAKFEDLCRLHGGRLKELPRPRFRIEVRSPRSGFIAGFATEDIGWIGVKIKAGRARAEDRVSPTAGFEFHSQIGDPIQTNDLLFCLLGDDKDLLESVRDELLATVRWSDQPVKPPPLVREILKADQV